MAISSGLRAILLVFATKDAKLGSFIMDSPRLCEKIEKIISPEYPLLIFPPDVDVREVILRLLEMYDDLQTPHEGF